jgi:hypothetical protein
MRFRLVQGKARLVGEGVRPLGELLEGPDEVTIAHAYVVRLLPEDHAKRLASLTAGLRDGMDLLVARHEDEPFPGRVVEEDIVVDSLTEGIDRAHDLPAAAKEPVDDRLTDVVVGEGWKASHSSARTGA